MKCVLFLFSILALTAKRTTNAFAPKVPVSFSGAGAQTQVKVQSRQKPLKQDESSTALEAYAMGGYTNGNNLMYRSGGYGRYSGGYGGYGYDRPYSSSYALMPDEARRGYGGYYDRQYYNSPYRYGNGYNNGYGYGNGYGGYYNDRFDMNRRYSNGYGGYGGYNRYGRGYGGYYDSPGMDMARMRGAEELRRRDIYGGYGGRGYYGSGYYGNSYYGNGYNRYGYY